MAIALKITIRAACLAAMMIGAVGASYAVEEEEESYYLSQMRNMANAEKNQPDVATPSTSTELLAETDLDKLAKAATEVEELDDVTPSLAKPSLPALKPEL